MGRDEGFVKGDSLQCNTVVSATDSCWSVPHALWDGL